MTSTAASSRDTAASTVVGCRSVTSSTWPPSVQAVTVPPSKPSTIASSPPTKNPRSSSWPSCEKCSQPSTLCSAIVLHGSRDPPEPTTQLLIRLFTGSGLRIGNAARNNLAVVLDDFPIPVAIFAIGHDAEFNTVSHCRLGPSARNDYRGRSGHSLHSEHTKARRPGSGSRGEISATISILPPHRLQAGSDNATISLAHYHSRSQRIDGPDGSAGGSLGFGT